MTTSSPSLHTAGSALPVRPGAACGGIGGPASLCTILPPAEPTLDEEPCYHFVSADFQECVPAHELDLFHSIFQAALVPYTVQYLPIVPLADRDNDDDYCDWRTHPSLTADQRNSY